MDMKGEYRIEAPRDRVWAALNDPDVLKDCIPGCQTMEKTSPTEFSATATVAVGPVKARFTGDVALTDLNPPESYTISGEGKGGAAGFAAGGAKVHLTEEGPTTTLLRYEVSANVGGKLAQLGGRLIDGTAKKMADQFFRCFSERVAPAPAPAEPEPAPHEVDVEPGVRFPPAQPSAHAAASAAVGGPGTGTKAAAADRAERPPESAEEHAAAEGSHAHRPGTVEAARTAGVTETPISRTGGDHARQPAPRGLSPITWIAGVIVVVLLLVLLLS